MLTRPVDNQVLIPGVGKQRGIDCIASSYIHPSSNRTVFMNDLDHFLVVPDTKKLVLVEQRLLESVQLIDNAPN